jgi:hypothetical protein
VVANETGAIRVRLSHGAGLKSADSNGCAALENVSGTPSAHQPPSLSRPTFDPAVRSLSDPYVKLTLKGITQKSATIKKNLNPNWSQDFTFAGTYTELVSHPLTLSVWDWDRFSSDDHLGDGTLDLRTLNLQYQAGAPLTCTVQLGDGQAKPGVVVVAVSWEVRPHPSPTAPSLLRRHSTSPAPRPISTSLHRRRPTALVAGRAAVPNAPTRGIARGGANTAATWASSLRSLPHLTQGRRISFTDEEAAE